MAVKLGKWDKQIIEHGGTTTTYERVKIKGVWTPVCKTKRQ